MKCSTLFSLLLLLAACGSGTGPEHTNNSLESETTDSVTGDNTVITYANFLLTLATNDVSGISKAGVNFRELFRESTPELADQGHTYFEQFYSTVQRAFILKRKRSSKATWKWGML